MENVGDPDIEELKEEIKKQGILLQDTNRMVHKLRRNIWWSRVWGIVWWVIIFIVAGGAYYYYAQPYVDKLEQYYANFQSGASQAQNFGTQVEDWFAQFGAGTSTKPQ